MIKNGKYIFLLGNSNRPLHSSSSSSSFFENEFLMSELYPWSFSVGLFVGIVLKYVLPTIFALLLAQSQNSLEAVF